MEARLVAEALKGTTMAENQKEASGYLNQCCNVPGFTRLLLDLAVSGEVECAVRQAAVIYFKNQVDKCWEVDEEEGEEKSPSANSAKTVLMNEQDKASIRQKLIPAIIHSPEPIRVHLCTAIHFIMRTDFPTKWPHLVEELIQLLHSSDGDAVRSALLVIHRLCKIYEYKRNKEKGPLVACMRQILPLLMQRFSSMLGDSSSLSCLLQKQIMKIFYCLVQFSLNTDMVTVGEMDQWIRLLMSVVERPVPEECLFLIEKETMEKSVWWKCKKWALKIVARVFERYGTKGQVESSYEAFADHFSKEFAVPIVHSIMKSVLDDYVRGAFVSDRVLFTAIGHLAESISQAQVWLVVKPHWQELLQSVVFPLLMYSVDEEEMWEADAQDFITYKYDVYEELHSPCSAAGQLLQAMSRRSGVLQPTLEFILSHLTSAGADVKRVDPALNMVGLLASSLNKNKRYKKDVEKLIHAHVIPRLDHDSKFIRYRACYAVKSASDTAFHNNKILSQLVTSLVQRLIAPSEELPVKVEAALAIQALIVEQEQKMVALLKPHVKEVLLEVLRTIATTRLEDLPPVVDSLLENFEEDIIPVAYDITAELVNIFYQLSGISAADGDGGGGVGNEQEQNSPLEDDNTVAIMGVLSTIETILTLIEDHKEIVRRVEPIIRRAVVIVFENECVDYYEEMLSVAQCLICVEISGEMWRVYELIYKALIDDKALMGSSFFSDCAPALYSFVTVDPQAFLSVPNRVQALYAMCTQTLQDEGEEADEQAQAYAAKLLEVFVLKYKDEHAVVDAFVPLILQLLMSSLGSTRSDEHSSGLRAQLLVTVIALFHSNEQLFFTSLSHLPPHHNGTFNWLTSTILNELDHFEGVHSRKLLIYFLCRLSTLPLGELLDPGNPIRKKPSTIMETQLKLFDGLQKCLKALAENEDSDDDDSDDEKDSSDEETNDRMGELKDSDDDIDEGTMEYLDMLNDSSKKRSHKKSEGMENGDGDDEFRSTSGDTESYHHFVEETDLEAYETAIDKEEGGLNVFLLFKRTFQSLQETDPALSSLILSGLSGDEKEELKKLTVVCNQQEAMEESKRVSLSGGYQFDASAPVPSNFKFSS